MMANAGAAAAAAARQKRQEEEEMTPYGREDLSEDWEFKILRSATGAFKHPHKLKAALDEEAQSGWVLVEKFDNSRIRLKRPASAKTADVPGGIDPYRTYVGASEWQVALIVVVCILAACAAVIGLVAALAS